MSPNQPVPVILYKPIILTAMRLPAQIYLYDSNHYLPNASSYARYLSQCTQSCSNIVCTPSPTAALHNEPCSPPTTSTCLPQASASSNQTESSSFCVIHNGGSIYFFKPGHRFISKYKHKSRWVTVVTRAGYSAWVSLITNPCSTQ